MDHCPPESLLGLDGAAVSWCGGGAPSMYEAILDAAQQVVPGMHVGICAANRDDTFATVAGTDPLVFMLDEMQYDLDDGPGLTAMRKGHTVIVDDAESEHRWPDFMFKAVGAGLRSHVGVPILVGDRTLGGLNMYSTTRTPLEIGRLTHARRFAAQAGIALGQAQRENDLVSALQSSRTIGKAIGLVMERFDLDDHEAFEHLARLSQKSNLELRDIATHLVSQSNDLRRRSEQGQSLHRHQSPDLTLVPQLDAAKADQRTRPGHRTAPDEVR